MAAGIAVSAAARRWARREFRRLLDLRTSASLIGPSLCTDSPAYGVAFLPAVADLVEDLTPDRAAALLIEASLTCHWLTVALAASKDLHAVDDQRGVLAYALHRLDAYGAG